jgi:hypothetical protein
MTDGTEAKHLGRETVSGLSQLSKQLHQCPIESFEQFSKSLNEVIQKESCFQLDELQMRILLLKSMISYANNVESGNKLVHILNQHLLHSETAARALHHDSVTPVQDSMWGLYERVLKLPSLKPDLFGAAKATIHENLPTVIGSELLTNISKLLPDLIPPENFFWKQEFTIALEGISKVAKECSQIVTSLKEAPEGKIKTLLLPLEEICDIYDSFLTEFQHATPNKQNELIIPKAQLTGVGLGIFSLDQNTAMRLLCRDINGTRYKENTFGTHSVCYEGGVFYKPNPEGRFYIGPEVEFAVYAFYHLLASQGAAPTLLAKVQNVYFDSQFQPFGRVLQAGYGINGISLHDLIGICEILPFLERSLGEHQAIEALIALRNTDYEAEFLQDHPNLSLSQLGALSLEDSAEILLKEYIQKFEGVPEEQRMIEFTDLSITRALRLDFYSHISLHSTKWLVCGLALLEKYPDLIRSSNKQSFTKLTDFAMNLHKSLEHFPSYPEKKISKFTDILRSVDPENFSAHFVVTLLTNPYDHKSDNFIVNFELNSDQSVDSVSLVGIDNDMAFANTEDGVRSIIYLLPQMNSNFSAVLRSRLLDMSAEILVFDWLVALEEQNRRYSRWHKQGILQNSDLYEDGESSLRIPLKLQAHIPSSIYSKSKQLVDILRSNSEITHWEILTQIQPRLSQAYQSALKLSSGLEHAYSLVPRQFIGKSEMIGSEDRLTIAEAAESFLEGINLNDLTLSKKVTVMGKALRTFPTINYKISQYDSATLCDIFLMAVTQGYHELVARLLVDTSGNATKETLLNCQNPSEQTAFLIACSRVDEMMLHLLLSHGANSEVQDIGHRTSIVLCLMQFPILPTQSARAIRIIGENTYVSWNLAGGHRGWTPLHHLVSIASKAPEEAEPLLTYMISKGASPDICDESGLTPLDVAFELGNDPLVQQLIDLGAGRTLNIEIASKFFQTRNHLHQSFEKLKQNSLLFRWQLALNALRKIDDPTSEYILEGSQLGKIGLPVSLGILNERGNINSQYDYGRRNVAKATLPGGYELFFKQFPEMPGVEYAVDKLFELLIGHGTSFTDLGKLTLANGKCYPVLISQGIPGMNLHEALLSHPELVENLDAEAFSELLIASMLVNFEDAKPDNFIVEVLFDNTGHLVGIDNDHAFVEPLVRDSSTKVQVKCILYCLDQMKQPIHPCARERFLAVTPERILNVWLNQLILKNKQYCELFSPLERKELFQESKNRSSVVIPIPFREGAIADIYQKFQRIQLALRDYDRITGLELLRVTIPKLGVRYEESFNTHHTPLARFYSLVHTQYSTAIAGRYQTLLNSRHILKSMRIPELAVSQTKVEMGPDRAFVELQNLLSEIKASNKERRDIRSAMQQGITEPFLRLVLNTEKEKILNGIPDSLRNKQKPRVAHLHH